MYGSNLMIGHCFLLAVPSTSKSEEQLQLGAPSSRIPLLSKHGLVWYQWCRYYIGRFRTLHPCFSNPTFFSQQKSVSAALRNPRRRRRRRATTRPTSSTRIHRAKARRHRRRRTRHRRRSPRRKTRRRRKNAG